MSSKKISSTLESLNIFFKTLGFISLYAPIIPFVVTWWFSRSLEQAIIIALGFGILAVVLFCGTVKEQMVKVVGVPQMFPINLNEYPQLDRTALEAYTQALEALGFKYLGDVGSRTGESLGMIRVFWHSTHNCFTELGQLISTGNQTNIDLSLRLGFGTSLDKNWTVSTTNGTDAVTGFIYMMRRPKTLWQSFPKCEVNQLKGLLESHLELCHSVSSTLNLEILSGLNMEWYVHHNEDEGIQRQAALEKRSILIASIEAYLFELNPKYEWLGDYAKFAKRSR